MTELIISGLLGLLIGVILRTAAPFAQKLYEGKLSLEEFLNRFIALAAGAFITSATLYLSLAPLTDEILSEVALTFFLGVAGNELFNRVYHILAIVYEKEYITKK